MDKSTHALLSFSHEHEGESEARGQPGWGCLRSQHRPHPTLPPYPGEGACHARLQKVSQ